MNLGGTEYPVTAAVIKEMHYDLVIGRDIIKDIGPLYLDMNRKILFIPNGDILDGVVERRPKGVIIPVAAISDSNRYGIPDKPFKEYVMNFENPPAEKDLIELKPDEDWDHISINVGSREEVPWYEWFNDQVEEFLSAQSSSESASNEVNEESSTEENWINMLEDYWALEVPCSKENYGVVEETHNSSNISSSEISVPEEMEVSSRTSKNVSVNAIEIEISPEFVTSMVHQLCDSVPQSVQQVPGSQSLYKIDFSSCMDLLDFNQPVEVLAIEQPKVPVAENLERKVKS